MTLAAKHMHLSRGPKVNYTRPAADPLFASAARVHGRQVLGIVLSGEGSDGAEGLRLVREHGGTALVQHPHAAASSSMPLKAMMLVHPVGSLSVDEIACRVRSFCSADL